MDKVFIGPKLRQLRKHHKHTQAELGKLIGVTAAYVNLLENNQRTLTVKVLMSLTDVYGISAQELAQTHEAEDLNALRMMVRDPIFSSDEPDLQQLRGAVAHAPQFVDRFKELYNDYQRLAEFVQNSLSNNETVAAQSNDETQIYDFFKANRNYFPKLEAIADRLRQKIGHPQDELYHRLKDYLRSMHGIRCHVEKLSLMENMLMTFDDSNNIIRLSEGLDAPNRIFQLAYIIARVESYHVLQGFQVKNLTARNRLFNELLNYVAAAIVMPYDAFYDVATKTRYDIDRIAAAFGVTFEQVAHRLTTLQASGKQGIPFFLIRLDRAGNITKRVNPNNAVLADFGGRCSVWNIHNALQSPNVVLTQAVELPDGTRYATIARTTDRSVYSRKTQDRRMIVALGCELQFANDITYFDESGHRFDQDPAPIGLNCQTCGRHHCAQRAHHPLHVTLNFETHRRGATRYEN